MRTEHLTKSLVQQVRGRVVSLDTMTTLLIDYSTEVSLKLCRELLHQMDSEVILTLGIKDPILRAISSDEEALITDLSTHLSIEGCLGEDYLIEDGILLLHLTIAQDLCATLQHIIADEANGRAFTDYLPVTCIYSSSVARTLLLLLHCLIKACFINAKPLLCEYKSCQVKWEAVGIIKHEGIVSIKDCLTSLLGFFDLLIQEANTRLQCT